jgi:hypothetical protein
MMNDKTVVRNDITLSTGAIISHTRMPNGAQEATVSNRINGEMTHQEWAEYCLKIRQVEVTL